ncbi:MAG: toxin secretion protein [Planctomycetota bacterium]|nr:MAG: toxin secretion protein [Planctomycetota bacterium]
MASPTAYGEFVLPALRLARTSRIVRIIARWLLWLLGLTSIMMLFAPWQQSVKGSGNVIAYTPTLRPQTIESPVKGRVVRWGKNIYENARVTQGELIVEIRDLDPERLVRLQEQEAALERQVAAARLQVEAADRNVATLNTIVQTYQRQLQAYQEVREQTLALADAAVAVAEQKLAAEQQFLQEQLAALAQLEADYVRQRQLFREGLASQLKFQEAERKWKEAVAKVAKAEAYVDAAKNDLEGKRRDRDVKVRKADIDIQYATALLRKARSDVAKAEADAAKAATELSKAQKELLEIQTKVARQQTQRVVAPFDGILVQVTPNLGGRLLKEGELICTVVPDTEERAVQIWLNGNDAPLVSPGRHVRLQFEGWPAIQFTGWPAVAVGTFGGRVVSVDPVDDGNGRFRVLVLPDPTDRPWPSSRYLRQGVRANGWVLLDQVPLWFELWRRFNAFPPSVKIEQPSKTPKLPKRKK